MGRGCFLAGTLRCLETVRAMTVSPQPTIGCGKHISGQAYCCLPLIESSRHDEIEACRSQDRRARCSACAREPWPNQGIRRSRVRLFPHSPELEASASIAFSTAAREILCGVRAGRADDTGYGPRPVLFRQLGAGRIAREGLQLFPAFGFEDVDAHHALHCRRERTHLSATGAWGRVGDMPVMRQHTLFAARCLSF